MEKTPIIAIGVHPILVVVVNNGLAPRPVIIFLLDDGGPIRRLTFLDYGGAIPVPIPVITTMAFTDGYAGPNWANPHAHIVSKSWRRNSRNGGEYSDVFQGNLLSHFLQPKQTMERIAESSWVTAIVPVLAVLGSAGPWAPFLALEPAIP